jgi:hypothetical protein
MDGWWMDGWMDGWIGAWSLGVDALLCFVALWGGGYICLFLWGFFWWDVDVRFWDWGIGELGFGDWVWY